MTEFPSKISISKSNGTSKTFTVIRSKFSRFQRCIFRNGFYPLVIAPFVTVAWLIDAYSCIGCNFININVGFEPINDAWKKSSINIGLFFYQDTDGDIDANDWMNRIHGSCQSYAPTFIENFIAGDKTWWMSQLMAKISLAGGGIAMVLIWSIALTPLPTGVLWPGILLPSVLISFLTSGSKFFFFETGICQSALWVGEGSNAIAKAADTCRISTDGILGIIASAVYGLSVILICLKSPSRMDEDENGIPGLYPEGLRTDEMEDSDSSSGDEEAQDRRNTLNLSRKYLLANDDATAKSVHSNTSSVYDLNNIRKTNEQVENIPKSISKKRLKKMEKVSRNELESESLRQVEPSVEYEDKDLVKIMGRYQFEKNAADTSEHSSIISYNEDGFYSPDAVDRHLDNSDIANISSCGAKSQIRLKLFSPSALNVPNAPSDEISNYSSTSPRKKYITPTDKGKYDDMKSMPTVATNNQTSRYDDELLNKCVHDLTKSFGKNTSTF